MQAAFIQQTGAPDVIQFGELPDPVATDSQVVVRVRAVSVNPIDTYIRSGSVELPLKFPWIPGCDFAGDIVECGAAVTRFQPGDRVWGSNQSLFGRAGSFAELAAVDEDWLYPTPSDMTDEVAAAGALVGITAHLGLFLHADLKDSDLVFVNGGTGGVGSSVVQLAKSLGCRVITTAGTAEKIAACRAMGADLALDYNSETLDTDIRAFADSNGGIDVWFETHREPNPERSIGLMAKRGRIVVMAGRNARPVFPVGPFYTMDLKVCGFAMFNASPDEQRVCANTINQLASAGNWNPPIGKVLPLSAAATAHQLQENNASGSGERVSGKIVLTV